MKDEQAKEIVRDRYGKIASQEKEENAASCCGATSASNKLYNIMMDDYSNVGGYVADADLGLGCGLPTEFAQINKGDTVLDLGSGAGNDAFVARHLSGAEGKVIGVDFTDEMIKKARKNAEKLKLNNVEFRQGDIEKLPVSDGSVDVVVSNCVLNLVPNKEQVMKEIFRVLKPGAHFSISDIVLLAELPYAFKQEASLYAGCISGAVLKDRYLQIAEDCGFINLKVQKEKNVELPDDILEKYLSAEDIASFKQSKSGIQSITLFAQKVESSKKESSFLDKIEGVVEGASCKPGSCC